MRAGSPWGIRCAAIVAALLLPGGAIAQVSVNSSALDHLQPAAPAATPAPAHTAPSKPAVHPAPRRPVAARPPGHPAAPAANTRASRLRPGLPPAVPAAPPAAAVLPPTIVPPSRPAPPPPPVPVVPTAPGDVSQIKGGVRITFGAGGSDLNPATEQAIRSFADTVKADPNADLNVYAFAAGVPDDPSTPRRLALARALTVRAILISDGIVSTRIYPRALGASPSPIGWDGPPDRVDLVLANTPAASP